MILYDLVCDKGHRFEAWFRDSATFDRLKEHKHLMCEQCGSSYVTKAITAPRLSLAVGHSVTDEASVNQTGLQDKQTDSPSKTKHQVSAPMTAEAHAQLRQILGRVRKYVEQNFYNAGKSFASEARAIQDGTAEKRGIYGEASPQDIQDLLEDGIDVLPFPSYRKDA